MATKYAVRRVLEPADGVRSDFTMPYPFLPGTIRVILNGVTLSLGEWVELSNLKFRMLSVIPRAGDFVEAFFVPL